MPTIVYSRPEHGSFPIWIGHPGDYMVLNHPLTPAHLANRRYHRWSHLSRDITGLRRPPSLRRYLGFNPFADQPSYTMFDWHMESKARQAGLGIDLHTRGHEVRKLFYAGFGRRVARSGFDPEEVLQEIFRGILARNNGKCPFDATKSSFGHYVHMVIECILNNYHRKEMRRSDKEIVGSWNPLTEESEDVAVSAANLSNEHSYTGDTGDVTDLRLSIERIPDNPVIAMTDQERSDARHVIPLLMVGKGKRDVAKETGISLSRVSQVVCIIRDTLENHM